ncbi:ABC transporter permease [Paenibacillus sepulcri]|uniref:ABC transporter permease n=1 Tax=Paenibacillus sepulcri TaxID=359917 RepID=A0ABS7CG96_9BACL|nr:ABC transporter permease [Paenibacillus sepulcri]
MIAKAFSADLLKIRGKGIWLLAIVGPAGLIAMQAVNFGLRYDYLTKQHADDLWGGLLNNILAFVPVSLFMGITLICSLTANIEHGMSSWKQLLALPISRTAVFAAKFAVVLLVLSLSCALLAIGTLILGVLLGFGYDFPVGALLKLCFFPFIASFPALALFLWMTLTFRNQALPVSIGLLMAVASLFSMYFTEWAPISWPLLGYTGPHRLLFVGAGLALGFVLLFAGSLHFERKDVE